MDDRDESEPGAFAPPPPPPPPPPAKRRKGWTMFLLRWGIAIVGIAWVITGLTIRDRVYVLVDDADGPVILDAALLEKFQPGVDATAVYEDPRDKVRREAKAAALLNGPDRSNVTLIDEAGEQQTFDLAGMRLVERPDARRGEMPRVTELFVFTPESDDGQRVAMVPRDQWAGLFNLNVPQPTVRIGLGGMVRDAKPWLLLMAVLVFPGTLICTGVRWWGLMGPLGIRMSLGRAYTLNMVGVFYNSFMLGNTGGDVIKAYYAGRHAGRGKKAAAWLSVFVDRVIGLIVLVIMGGSASLIQYFLTPDKTAPVAIASLQVAWASAALLLASSVGTFIALHRPTREVIRRRSGIDKVLNVTVPDPTGLRGKLRSKVREGLNSGYSVISAYARQPRSVVIACLLTVPVHTSVILSAMLAGVALGLPIPWPYYFVAVPVIVLSGSIPISPQGAGVMELFAVLLTRPQGATVAQAFALALCIRAVHILWNLTGGIVVLRGGYSQPAESDIEADDDIEGVRELSSASPC